MTRKAKRKVAEAKEKLHRLGCKERDGKYELTLRVSKVRWWANPSLVAVCAMARARLIPSSVAEWLIARIASKGIAFEVA